MGFSLIKIFCVLTLGLLTTLTAWLGYPGVGLNTNETRFKERRWLEGLNK